MSTSSDLVAKFTNKAKLAEHAERYEDMVACMKEVVNERPDLPDEDRNLLSVAYKNIVGHMRSAWRIVHSIYEKEVDENKKKLEKEYVDKIAEELVNKCDEVLALVNDVLLPNATSTESKVFFNKMVGDYNRYITEVCSSDGVKRRDETVEAAKKAYEAASEETQNLSTTHPIRLGLALNQSVFYYEILADNNGACALAKKAFDEAITDLDNLKEESYKDSTLIMQLLRDNLTLWTSENNEEEGDDAQN